MKKFRVSGFIDEVGASQVDVNANNEHEAEEVARDEYDFYEVVNVSELK